jgi:hypothetical protein
MKENKSLKVTTIILGIIVIGLIAFIFIRNNVSSNTTPDNSVATADDQSVSTDSNGPSSYVSGDDQTAAAVKARAATSSILDTYSSAVLKTYYSIIYPEGSAMVSSTSYSGWQYFKGLNVKGGWNASWNALAYQPSSMGRPSSGNPSIFQSTSICKHPVSVALAAALSDANAITGSNAQIMTTARRYVDWSGIASGEELMSFITGEFDAKPGDVRQVILPIVELGYCLDNNYVSNYPAYIDNFGSFLTARGFGPITNVFLTATTTSSLYSQSYYGGPMRF